MTTSEETRKANVTRVQKVKAIHDEKVKERTGNLQVLHAEYLKAKDSAVLADILEKCRSFSSYHQTVARDAVGANAVGDVIYFTGEQRLSHIDKSAGIQEIIDYIGRMVDDPAQKSMVQQVLDAEDEDTQEEVAPAE